MTKEHALNRYVVDCKKLDKSTDKLFGKAPYKPVLLLSIVQWIYNGESSTIRINIAPE
jgi:hypothetical protein